MKTILKFSLIPLISTLLIVATAATSSAQVTTTTVARILRERNTTTPNVRRPRYCSGGAFKPCVCWQDVTKRVMYRPSVRECGRKAAIIMFGNYYNAFSTVLRNGQNADRVPNPLYSTVNGCTKAEASSENPPNKCSVFKAQKVIRVADDRGGVAVHCLGTAGNSRFGLTARRITVKLKDVPNSTNDPIARLCLRGPDKNLN